LKDQQNLQMREVFSMIKNHYCNQHKENQVVDCCNHYLIVMHSNVHLTRKSI
jgi:hypothetical protein